MTNLDPRKALEELVEAGKLADVVVPLAVAFISGVQESRTYLQSVAHERGVEMLLADLRDLVESNRTALATAQAALTDSGEGEEEQRRSSQGGSDAAVYAPLPGRPDSPHSAGEEQAAIAAEALAAAEAAAKVAVKRAADELYSSVLETVQDYFSDNVRFNIRSRLDAAARAARAGRELMPLLASAWFYGGFVAETLNERRMQALMEHEGWWPIPSESALLLALDGGPLPAHLGFTVPPAERGAADGVEHVHASLPPAEQRNDLPTPPTDGEAK